MMEKTNKFLLCLNILLSLSTSLWKHQYLNEFSSFDSQIDPRTSRLLRGETEVETFQNYTSLEDKIAHFMKEDEYKFANKLNMFIDEENTLSKYNSLMNNNIFENKINALNSCHNSDKSYRKLKHAQSFEYVDYIDDKFNDFDYDYEQRLHALESDNHYRNKINTHIYEDDHANYDMLRDSFRKKYKAKEKSLFSCFINYMKKSDKRYEADLMNLLNNKYKIYRRNRDSLLNTTKMYFKVFNPVLIPIIAALIFHYLGSPLGVLVSVIVLNVASVYLGYKFIKFLKLCRNYKRMIRTVYRLP
ncbi:Plasmodium exported protein, unknown function [Plasmodium ovale]|uniref:Pv-fam-d protein n=1 Tax=Plasmodium ovale TaxID=36330 RepID=A0A1C3KK19_PLAOA|nr:Plasmodium exported protein, unknown function [Plasmodium ovale]